MKLLLTSAGISNESSLEKQKAIAQVITDNMKFIENIKKTIISNKQSIEKEIMTLYTRKG